MASPALLSHRHNSIKRTVASGVAYSTPEQDDWTKLTDLSSRRRVQNRLAQRHHRAMLRNRQNGKSNESLSSETSSKNRRQSGERGRSRSATSSKRSADSPCFIHYQPPQESFMEEPYQSEALPTPRHSPDYVQDQYSFEMAVSHNINALTPPPSTFLRPPQGLSPSEVLSGGNYLSRLDNIEIPYLCWDAAPEIENRQPNQILLSPVISKPYLSHAGFPEKIIYDSIPMETMVLKEEQKYQNLPHTPPQTYVQDNISYSYGRTALHLAAEQANLTIIKILLEAELDINARDEKGRSALHVAVLERHEAYVKLLLDKGANRHLTDREGRTALHLAAENGSSNIIALLLDYQVEVNMKDHFGKTALHRAIEQGHEAVVRLLLQRGADVTAMIDNWSYENDYQRSAYQGIQNRLI